MRCWGYNDYGQVILVLGWFGNLRWACSASVLVSRCVLLQLGDGSTSSQRSPVGVVGLSSGVVSVSSGGVSLDSVRYSLIACLLLRREFVERLLVLV